MGKEEAPPPLSVHVPASLSMAGSSLPLVFRSFIYRLSLHSWSSSYLPHLSYLSSATALAADLQIIPGFSVRRYVITAASSPGPRSASVLVGMERWRRFCWDAGRGSG